MSLSCQIELGASPLSESEVERVLNRLRDTWHTPSWVARQQLGEAVWLLQIRHESWLREHETAHELAENLAATLWQTLGRFVRLNLHLDSHEHGDFSRIFDEADYRRILHSHRFSTRSARR